MRALRESAMAVSVSFCAMMWDAPFTEAVASSGLGVSSVKAMIIS